MAEYLKLPNGRCDIKFHAKPKNFRQIVKLNNGKDHYEFLVDKNNSVYDVLKSVVKSWKTIEKGKRKFTVPDVLQRTRVTELFDIVKGRPVALAIERVKSIISASVTDNL